MDKEKSLKLENQLCFPLYLTAKEIITTYSLFLEPLDLTYTQYLVMMVMWEHETVEMKELGKLLSLDSNTLTPVINRLVKKGYLKKTRDEKDRRSVVLTIEPAGLEVKEKAKMIPEALYSIVDLTAEEADAMINIMEKVRSNLCRFRGKTDEEKR